MGCLNSKEQDDPNEERIGIGRTERMRSVRFPVQDSKLSPSNSVDKLENFLSSSDDPATTERTAFSDRSKLSNPQLDKNGHLLPSEVQNRRSTEAGETTYMRTANSTSMNMNMNTSTSTSTSTSNTNEQPLPIKYAICTQRGYYPDDPHKLNQDSYSVTLDFGNMNNDSSLFAVYDGHGPKGDIFAQYAKKELPPLIYKYVQQERARKHTERNKLLKQQDPNNKVIPFNPKLFPMLNEKEFEIASMKAHLECNKKVIEKHPRHSFDLSGTTAISAGIHNGKLIVSNVGDSRAVLGYRDAENLVVAIPLSKDQTPWRKDERDRVIKAGASVMTIDQIKGHVKKDDDSAETFGHQELGENDFIDLQGDPPRVWLPNDTIPGTSFTRSIGDAIADKIGVYAEPEFYSKDITDEDQVLVLASDGVFEFIPNQVVIDICAKCSSPTDACEEIVARSYEEWLRHEHRTDDITVIVMYIGDSVLTSNSVASAAGASGEIEVKQTTSGNSSRGK